MAHEANTERCVGCGAVVPRVAGAVHRYMTSAPGCWEAYGEVCAHHMGDPNGGSYRHWCADAFAVQHPGVPGPQAIQSVGMHLVSLYVKLERREPAGRAAAILQRGIAQKGYLHWLTPPSFEGVRTVLDMRDHLDDAENAARAWAESAWAAWAPHHPQVRTWHDELVVQMRRA